MSLLETAAWTDSEARSDDGRRGPSLGDSPRTLLGLMELSRLAESDRSGPHGEGLDGIISRPVLRSLLSALHYRSVTTVRHSRRVALLAVALAEHLGWEGRNLKLLEAAALMHDIGKIGVPDNILFKPAKLSPDELELMALHYNIGLDVLQACRADREVLEIVAHSQTSFGNADAVKRLGQESHLGGRILAVADAYESLATDQVYRPARPHDEIIKILSDAPGAQFDGNIVAALARFIKLHGIPFETHGSEMDESLRQRGPSSSEEAAEANALCQIFSHLYLLESLYDGFAIVDADLRVLVWNRGAESLLGPSSQAMIGHQWSSRLLKCADAAGRAFTEEQYPMRRVVSSQQPLSSEVQLTRADGAAVHAEMQTMPILNDDGVLLGVIEIYRDLNRSGSRRPQEIRELKLLASRDALTAVANRGELETQLATMVSAFGRNHDEPFSVIFVDADHFKSINDTHGHAVGDKVLIDLARLLQKETYSGEVVGRYGGEEFVVLCPGTALDEGVRRAERLRNVVRTARVADIERLRITASFGVSQAEPGDSVESVLRRADKALYMAKQTGRDKTCSLTNAQLLAAGTNNAATDDAGNLLQHTCWFSAVVAADMVVYKLGGYIQDAGAQLLEVTSEHVLMRHGHRSLWGYWGKSPTAQPVEIEILFGNSLGAKRENQRSTPKISIGVKIRPLGWLRDRSLFKDRARNIVRELKNYFAAD